jgi:hypothetical protein
MPQDEIHTCMMLYMSADNNLSVNSAKDIESITNQRPLEYMSVYVVHDAKNEAGIGETSEFQIFADDRRDQAVRATQTTRPKSLTDPNMFGYFLGRSESVFRGITPVHRVLCLWGHGGGLVMLDENQASSGPPLQTSVQKFSEVLAQSNASFVGGPRFNIIMFDACYMGMIETLNEFHGLTDYIIASSRKVPAAGFPYAAIMKELQGKIPGTHHAIMAAMIRDRYNAYYERMDPEGKHCTYLCDVSTIRDCTARLNALGKVMRPLLQDIGSKSTATALLQAALSDAKEESGYVEVKMFVENLTRKLNESGLESVVKAAIADAAEALGKAVDTTFEAEPGNEIAKLQSPLIWAPRQQNDFMRNIGNYSALKSSEKDRGGWITLLRALHAQ